MNKFHAFAFAALVASLAACGERDNAPGPDSSARAEPQTALGRTVARAMDEARAKLATENISLNGETGISVNGRGISNHTPSDLPKAEITPKGDLLIAGTAVKTDARQRDLLLAHRASLLAIAEAGMDIGVQGADLGMKAAGEAIAGIFTGNGDQVEQKIEAEAQKIEASALKLCDRMPAMLSTQNALAEALPEFRPYATMEQSDIDECHREKSDWTTDKSRAEVRQEVRQEIREGIRTAVRDTVQGTGLGRDDAQADAAAEAEAAPASSR